MELVKQSLKMSIGVVASSSENEMGNQFHMLWEGTIRCKEWNVEAREDVQNIYLVY